MKVQHFFDPDTFTLTYVVHDENTKDGLIIDPVLDFDPPSGRLEDRSLFPVVDWIKSEGIRPRLILETHAHADHLSSSQILKQIFPDAKLGIGERIQVVQDVFKQIFNLESEFLTNGGQFDFLVKDFQEFAAGTLRIKAIPTPGHTPACLSYLIGDAVFVGDALFMPDYGTGRCDFPKGSAKALYHSIHSNLYNLPDEMRVFVGHDYQPGGRELRFQTTIGESKRDNIQLKAATTEEEFIHFREGRDRTLKAPRLLLPSIQVNINAGRLPKREDNGRSYLKLPLEPQTKLGSL